MSHARKSFDPAGTGPLEAALEKIHHYARGIPLQATERHPETAQMMIMNPLSGGGLAGDLHRAPRRGGRARLRRVPSADSPAAHAE